VTDLVYSAIQEFGGVIDARTMGGPSQWLVFDIGGQTIFARTVTIPASPYMRPAAIAGRQACADAVADVIRAAI
jgi:hypothetical protein